MKRFFLSIGIALVLLLAFSARTALAIVEKLSLEELTRQASTILIGRVVGQTSRWNPEKTVIVTDVSVVVDGSLKGEAPANFVLEVPGGIVGDLGLTVSDTPVFAPDETVILFLREPDFSGFRLVGWQQGKFTVHDGFVLREGESPLPLEEFATRVRKIMGETGPLPSDLAALISRLAPNLESGGESSLAPVITSITPNTGPAHMDQLRQTGSGCAADSTHVTITGSGFGASQGSSYIRFWWEEGHTYYSACVESWSDTQIVARVPGGVSSGPVAVIVGGLASNEVYFTVTYSYIGGKWPAGNFPTYFVNPNTTDVSGTYALSAVQAAAATWKAAGANFQFRYGGTTTLTDAGQDWVNAISWVNYDPDTVATTWFWWYTSNPHMIVEFDITFNDYYTWGTDGSIDNIGVQNAATFAFGLALGLNNLCGTADTEKTMYYYIDIGEVKKCTLEAEDIAGIRYIYGLAPVDLSLTENPIAFLNDVYPFVPNQQVLKVQAKNVGTAAIDNAVVRFYQGDPDNGGTQIGGDQTLPPLSPGGVADTSVLWNLSGNVEDTTIYARGYVIGQTDLIQNNNTVSKTVSIYYVDFRHDVDAFRFPNWHLEWADIRNDLWAIIGAYHPEDIAAAIMFPVIYPVVSVVIEHGAHCFGMASTSILYKEHPEIKPVPTATFNMDKEVVEADIQLYQRWQFARLFDIILKDSSPAYNAADEYNSALHHIRDLHEPIMLMMYQPGHTVVAYKVVALGDEKRVYLYDSNVTIFVMTQVLYGVFWPASQTFAYSHGGNYYTKAYAEVPLLAPSDEITVLLERLFRWIIENIIRRGIFQVFVDSPVSPLITDQYGRRIGYVDGSFVNEIPGASMSALSEIKTFDLPWDLSYTVRTLGTQTGTMDLNFLVPTSENTAQLVLYDNVPVSLGSSSQTQLYKTNTDWTMLLDGSPRQPDEVRDITIYKSYLPIIMKTLSR